MPLLQFWQDCNYVSVCMQNEHSNTFFDVTLSNAVPVRLKLISLSTSYNLNKFINRNSEISSEDQVSPEREKCHFIFHRANNQTLISLSTGYKFINTNSEISSEDQVSPEREVWHFIFHRANNQTLTVRDRSLLTHNLMESAQVTSGLCDFH